MFGFDLNLLRPPEIILLADAIRAMVFKVHRHKTVLLLEFEGAVKFKLDQVARTLSMYDTTQREIIQVFAFSKWKPQHWFLWRRLHQSLIFHDKIVHKVKLHNYRAMFGGQMEEIIITLAKLLEAAEAEAVALAKLDGTHGGTNYHPDIRRILQMDAPPPPDPPQKDPLV